MSTPPVVHACRTCDYRAHPPRLLCPRCGGDDWEELAAAAGVVTDVTELLSGFERRQLLSGTWIDPGPEPPRIAVVEADAGARFVVRLEADLGVGARVRLAAERGRTVAYGEDEEG